VGLRSTGSRHFRLAVLGANYEDRILAYPAEAVLTLILPRSLREIAHEIIREVFVSIKGEEVFAQLQSEPGLCVQSFYPEALDALWFASARKDA
jgi:hypothetical protein